MRARDDEQDARAVRGAAQQLTGGDGDYDDLLDLVGGARVVLLGEATHGTHEFYHERAAITRRLIEEKGFRAVAVEADWPDAYRVNRYVRGAGDDHSAEEALSSFKRFPAWMWRNREVLQFVDWLHDHNARLPAERPRVGFYGLDLYSLHASMAAVIEYLEKVDPEAARRADYRYSCFENFGLDPQAYGAATSWGRAEPCEDEVVAQLRELQQHFADYYSRDGKVAEDEYFYAEQNARLAVRAEEYYRAMFRGSRASWNLRDTHMVETLEHLIDHLERPTQTTRVVVWAHNSHIGDARATEMGERGEVNVGQLVRQRFGDSSFLLGFTTYAGTITAASDWGGPTQLKRVRQALPGSYELLLHLTGLPRLLLNLGEQNEALAVLQRQRLERAIGVIYLPETERLSHYFYAQLPRQFDAAIHIDNTRAVEPLDVTSEWVAGETPETYPFAV